MKFSTRRSRVNKALCALDNYHEAIPLDAINRILEKNGFMLTQEDDTRWSGFFCGESGRAAINVADMTQVTYAYIRINKTQELVDAVMMPDNGRSCNFNRNFPMYTMVDQQEITKEEYETFHAMDMQTMDVYDESTMRWNRTTSMLILEWYKMPSGRYEINTYMS